MEHNPDPLGPARTSSDQLGLDSDSTPVVEMFDHDPCCTKAFQRASLKGELSTNVWTCPKCGCLWMGHTNTEASIRTWRPQEMIEIIRANR